MQDLEKLVSLAKVVRVAFERYVARSKCHSSDLCGFCHDASSVLLKLAKKHGINGVQMGEGSCHWFVLLDNMIVDVTSTQFKHPDKVAVLPIEQAQKIGEWWHLYDRMDAPKWPDDNDGTRFAMAAAEEMLASGEEVLL